MQVVKMEGIADCGAACLAMVLGFKKASDVYPVLGYNPCEVSPMGVSDVEVISILRRFNRVVEYVHTREAQAAAWSVPIEQLEMRVHMPVRAKLQARLGAMQTGCAIVAVPSLNYPNTEHFVFCKKGEVYDPSPRQRYHGSANSLPLSCVIFIEEM